jgi:hypothetical protein
MQKYMGEINSMKYGLLKYDTNNIGDDIQSIAIERFLPKIDYLVNRDNLSSVKDVCKLILNGWYMHRVARSIHHNNYPYDFPPPDNFETLITSFHLDVAKLLNIDYNIDYFKRHEPIGCRDLYTLQLLKDKGIEVFFSGCVTLTLKRSAMERTDEVFCVDVDEKYKGIHLTHKTREVEYYKRRELANRLLQKYARAKKVITSRLHCYLPCIAFGTNVEYVGIPDKRFDGLLNIKNKEYIIKNLENQIELFIKRNNSEVIK